MTTGKTKAMRWKPWQFSLRFLLLLMFGAAAFCSGWKANDWRRETELKQASKNKSPAKYFLPDDVQYFDPGPEIKLTRGS